MSYQGPIWDYGRGDRAGAQVGAWPRAGDSRWASRSPRLERDRNDRIKKAEHDRRKSSAHPLNPDTFFHAVYRDEASSQSGSGTNAYQ